MSAEKKSYDPAIDVLRIIAILSVVLIHTTTKTFDVVKLDITAAPTAFILNQVVRFCVPLFFFISGFVLELNYRNNTNYPAYFKKRLSKVLIPFIFWSALYFAVFPSKPLTVLLSPHFVSSLLKGSASYHLYFIPALLLFYAAFPLFHRYFKYLSNKWMISIIFISHFLFVSYDYYVSLIRYPTPIRVAIFSIPFFFMGIFVSHHKEKILHMLHKNKIYIYCLTAFVTITLCVEAWNLYLNSKNYLYIYNQWRPLVTVHTFLVTASLYLLFEHVSKGINVIKSLAALSFFVYFVHIVVMEKVWKYGMREFIESTDKTVVSTMWYDIFFFLIVAGISFFIAFCLHRVKFLRFFTG